MRLLNVVAVAMTILGLELAGPGLVEAQQRSARVQVSVTVVSAPAVAPAVTDSLVREAASGNVSRFLPSGVRVRVKDQAPAASTSEPRIRRVAIEYVAS
jgi:hypothetical protein